ncbi:MAG: phosphate signaling complex protein PhoU [Verrucomicrobia bacterium]|nr:phosphate signaling complex protein PhoU [Verrucomicrobiota bacterium]
MERHFDEELNDLKHRLTKMCALAETMIGDAIKALVQRDASALTAIQQHEAEVNRLQVEIDEMCFTMIALRQPTASDLRFILGATKTTTDLERLADQAVNISNKAERLMKQDPLKPFVIIPQMTDIARGMVRDSLHAYVNRQVEKAREVIQRDAQLNALKKEINAEMLEFMQRNPATVPYALDIVLVAHNLERIGDHAKNIAENAVFVIEGKDIRHGTENRPAA